MLYYGNNASFILATAIILLGLCYDNNGGGRLPVVNGSLLLPHQAVGRGSPSFILGTPRGGSTRALDKDAIIVGGGGGQQQQRKSSNLEGGDGGKCNRNVDGGEEGGADDQLMGTEQEADDAASATRDPADDTAAINVMKKDGTLEPLDEDKVRARVDPGEGSQR